ncbi:hypothetical protein FXF53_30845 [Micromonospora sp. WP24]|uniref:AbiTii domain-containing protein n=1 Tax=Micromonospora sp. WP24 TaxID=2604469 RepID=UPI0011D80F2F|nr:hypothetical protein [Micromonospora sp. WP24]TYB90447.1 hypothetical protein FXF53_30845 [Micromonospora sp. WP24]
MNRRDQALSLADELLTDIELARTEPLQTARKCSRLARLLDDFEAMGWLEFEVSGYPPGNLDSLAWSAAKRSGRVIKNEDGTESAHTTSAGALSLEIQAGLAQIQAAVDRPVSVASANPSQFVSAPRGNTAERSAIRNHVSKLQNVVDHIVGAMHQWVLARHYELRFGAAAETAFAVVRSRVDGEISRLVPGAVKALATAFENATSDNSEQWANAASACRRLIKAVADALRPPGPPVGGRKMGDENYINRLADWIQNRAKSETQRDVILADLEFLGRRLAAFTDAGNKGAHAEVTQFEASRYITGTYLLLGDLLTLSDGATEAIQVEPQDVAGKVEDSPT